ncbi:MAG: MBL fold metallo-hydrolase, partial [Proteobacteria bacterium]|nr:MBL fold metallo-hydrolase [Pseudomonadota bacterium]
MTIPIPFTHKYDFEYARIEQITPLIRRITARNPSGFTFHGTGTYIIGRGNVAVI